MSYDKLKQYVALFGGWLSAVLLFLRSLGYDFGWLSEETIGAFTNVLLASIPFVLVAYGIWKNSYVITKEAKEQEVELKKKGLK